ncbi:MAG: acyl-CoA dehydrogenase family protein, partial [Candidatus Aminicenantes bacterium]|nr:acyl-CoA dehydrogenase family protein [Candidatus Aminicenantes bacterium]
AEYFLAANWSLYCYATMGNGTALIIQRYGTQEQQKKYVRKLTAAQWGGTMLLTEPEAGSDASATKTTAKLENQQWTINGSKIFITNSSSPISSVCMVLAKTGKRTDGKDELSSILVPNGTPGFETKTMKKKLMWRSSDTGELYFDDCQVPEENLLGKRGEGFHQMMETLDNGRLAIAAMGLGGSQGAYELAMKYSKERHQFGVPISTFQVNAFKLADMATEIETARALLYKACRMKNAGLPFSKIAAMSKLYCSEVMGRVVDHAVQLHGGYGLMKEYAVERFYRDQKLLTIGEGTSEIQRLVISRQIGCHS